MKLRSVPVLSDKQKQIFVSSFNPEDNKYITETAGFVPLDVKLKRFEESGMIMQFNSSEFDSSDYRDMYMSPDFEILPSDDLEEINEKLQARDIFVKELLEQKRKYKTSDFPPEENQKSPPAGSQKEENQNDDEIS